ncbi:MAG TPA: hypothetical protein ENG70_01390 [Candidatus Cloacimonetes bacterium]|nr:hypothetical protein [Candidatus Cloacimonadota bacterium]HEX37503.1 hypothetical protein [Candidatus Cloacimonadota bacterium]
MEISHYNTEKEKKLRAALAGIMQYLYEEKEKKESKKSSSWVINGRKLIMQNQIMVQRRSAKWKNE